MVGRGAPPDGTAVEDAYDRELFRVAAVVAIVWQFALLLQVLILLHGYRQPAVALGVWLGLLAAAAWLVPQVRSGGLTGRQAAAAAVIAVAAVALLGWERNAHSAAGSTDWSVFGIGWLLILAALSRPARVWMTGAMLVYAADAVFAFRLFGTSPENLGRLATTGYILVVVLAVFASIRPALRTQAGLAARRVALVSRSAAEQAATAASLADRRDRFAVLEKAALPLLRGIADGSLDADDPSVRRRCAEHAATLRRALTDHARQGSGLLTDLAPALAAAAARGLAVEVQVIGNPGPATPEVADATRRALGSVLGALPAGPVILTVLASGADVEVFLTFGDPPDALPDVAVLGQNVPAAECWSATVAGDDAGGGCFEARWRQVTQ